MNDDVSGAARMDLDSPGAFINHRLSWMRFNERVLALTGDDRHPLLERLRFLCIAASNLDEFVEVRLPQIEEKRRAGAASIGPDHTSPEELLGRLDDAIDASIERQYAVLERLRGELAAEGIHLLDPDRWSDRQRQWTHRVFEYDVAPILSHTPVDPDRPFPRVFSGAVNLLVEVERGEASAERASVVRMPRRRSPVVRFPPSEDEGVWEFALLSDLVAEHVDRLFPDGRVRRTVSFRAVRDTDVDLGPERARGDRMAVEDELLARPFGDPVRLEVGPGAPDRLARQLRRALGLPPSRCQRVDGPVGLARLEAMLADIERPDLEYEAFEPGVPGPFRDEHVFEVVEDRDVVVHRPYESFDCFVDFVETAARDPRVTAIQQTVYRTELQSPVTDALVRAARAGKEVTAVVELRARFDEEENVELADRLRDAGATVVFGPRDYKVHAKMALVRRRQDDTEYRYAHLATGNYHPSMARQYTDLGYFTSDRAITRDVAAAFDALERDEAPPSMDRLLVAPRTLADGVVRRIEREIAHAHLGHRTGIRAKMNRLTDPDVIRALYRASRAGVSVDLIVRGMCRLRPGVEGLSEEIRVRSVVGRFLEHSRAFCFANGGSPDLWLSSADWREKNLRRRVEHAVAVDDEDVGRRVAAQVFDAYLTDNTDAWELHPDGSYRRLEPGDDRPDSAQEELLEQMRRPL